MDSFTLADLVKVTGAPRRAVSFWADTGVIIPVQGTNRAGKGTHRQFSKAEAIVACIIANVATLQISVGKLIEIAHSIRSDMTTARKTGRAMRTRIAINSVFNGQDGWGSRNDVELEIISKSPAPRMTVNLTNALSRLTGPSRTDTNSRRDDGGQ